MRIPLTYTEEIVPINKLKEDQEFKELVPQNNSREELEKSIKENSQIFPLITDRNYILIDGYTRLDIMKKNGYKAIRILRYDFDSQQDRDIAYELIWTFNGVRRQLDKNEKLALFQKIADRIAKVKASKKITDENKLQSHATVISSDEMEKFNDEDEELVTLEDGTKIKAREYEDILKELDKENKALSESEKHKMAILRINAPWLLKYVTDQKYKVPLDQAFRIYTKAKELGILEKIKALPTEIRDQLIATKDGRKIILNDEYRDILEKVLSGQYTIEKAFFMIKQKEIEKRDEKTENQTERKREKIESEAPLIEPQINSPVNEEKTIVKEIGKEESKTEESETFVNSPFNTDGFFEIPNNSVIVRIGNKLYVINEDALRDLEQGRAEKWKKLVKLLSDANLIVQEEDNIYIVMWRLMCKC